MSVDDARRQISTEKMRIVALGLAFELVALLLAGAAIVAILYAFDSSNVADLIDIPVQIVAFAIIFGLPTRLAYAIVRFGQKVIA